MAKVGEDHEHFICDSVKSKEMDLLHETNPAPNMWSLTHLGVYASYLCVGFIYGSATAIIYPIVVILNQEPNNKQQAIQNMFTLFWSYKIFFGMLSDTVPVRGQRRKPYLLLGWGIAIACSIVLALLASFSGTLEVCYNKAGARIECSGADVDAGPFTSSALNVNSMVLLMTANNFGYVMADVAMDSLAIEYAKREHPDKRGEIQGMCYTTRAAGFVIAALIVGFGFNGEVFKGDFPFSLSIPAFLWILVGLQCVGLPWWIALEDTVVGQDAQFQNAAAANFRAMWDLLCNKTMAQLMIFNIIMNISTSVLVNARNSVLNLWVDMDPLVNAVDQDFEQVVTMITLYAAAKWLKKYNWRLLLVAGTAFWTIWQLMFWLVVFDVDRHSWFVVMIDLDQQFAQAIGYLVVMWAVVEMAPKGIEGTTLALATSVGNAGQSMGNYIVMAFNAIFSLDQKQIEADSDVTRRQYWYNSMAVIAVQWMYLLCLCWMPSGFAHAKREFQKEASTKSKFWAWFAAFWVCFSVIWGTLSTIMAFVCPCNVIFGGPGCEPHLFSCAASDS